MKGGWWFIGFSLFLSVAQTAAAQSAPVDEVRLTSGGVVRGIIVEDMPGDHVSIQLPTGEVRTFAASEIAYSGPISPQAPVAPPTAPPVAAPVPPPAVSSPPDPRVQLRVEADSPDITLHQVVGTGSATVSTGRGVASVTVNSFGPVCTAPCEVRIQPGTYRFGVSMGHAEPRLAGHNTHSILRDTTLRLEYESRAWARILGWVMFGVGAAGAAAAVIVPTIATPSFDTGILVGGLIPAGVLIIAGMCFAFLQDHADVVEPVVRF